MHVTFASCATLRVEGRPLEEARGPRRAAGQAVGRRRREGALRAFFICVFRTIVSAC